MRLPYWSDFRAGIVDVGRAVVEMRESDTALLVELFSREEEALQDRKQFLAVVQQCFSRKHNSGEYFSKQH